MSNVKCQKSKVKSHVISICADYIQTFSIFFPAPYAWAANITRWIVFASPPSSKYSKAMFLLRLAPPDMLWKVYEQVDSRDQYIVPDVRNLKREIESAQAYLQIFLEIRKHLCVHFQVLRITIKSDDSICSPEIWKHLSHVLRLLDNLVKAPRSMKTCQTYFCSAIPRTRLGALLVRLW